MPTNRRHDRPLYALLLLPAALALTACTFPKVLGDNMASGTDATTSTTTTTGPGDPTTGGSTSGTTSTTDVLVETTNAVTTDDLVETTNAVTSASDPSAGTTTSEHSTDGAGCLFWEASDPEQQYPPEFTCGLPERCPGDGPLVFVVDGPLGDPDSVQTDDIDRARCMAAALRDRLPGQMFFGRQLGLGFDRRELEVVGLDVIDRLDYIEDFNFEKTATILPLLPPDDFAECAEGTALQIWMCLTRSYEEACTLLFDCPP